MPLCLSHLLNTSPAWLYFHKQHIQVLDLEMMLVWWDSIFTSWLDVWRFFGAALEVPRNRGLGEARRAGLQISGSYFNQGNSKDVYFVFYFFARTLSCAAKRQTNTHTKMPNNWKSLTDPQASSGSLGNQSWCASSTSPDSCLPRVLCDLTRSSLILRDRELNTRLCVRQ